LTAFLFVEILAPHHFSLLADVERRNKAMVALTQAQISQLMRSLFQKIAYYFS